MSAAARHTIEITVAEGDADELGHVNNAYYLRFVEEAARAHSAARGLALADYRRLGALPLVRAHSIHDRLPALPGDRLRVTTEIVRLEPVRAVRRTEVRRASDDALLAEAETEWVWVDASSGRPVRVPPAVRRAFSAV